MVEVPSSPQTSPHRWRRGLPALSVAVAVMLMGTAIILAAPGFSLDPFSPGGSISNHYDSPILEGTPALVLPTPTPFNAEPNQALSESAELITADEASTATPTVTSTSTIIPPTASPTRTPTTTFSATPTSTATPDTRTPTATATPSRTPTPSPVLSPSPTPTHTRTPTPSPYLSPTPTHTAAPTATPTPTWTPAPPPPSMGNIPRPHLGYGAFSSVGYASWVRGMGFGWMVWLLDWGLAEPSKGSYNWWALDQVLASAQANGIQVILRIDSSPAWARSGGTGSAPPNNLNDLGDFMAAVAQHAGNRVAGYVIWNEPNLSVSWGNQNPDPARYAQMLQAVYSRIKAVAPNAAVITAGMATTGNGGPGAMGDLDFIRGIYQNGVKDYFDVLGSHPYGFASPPEADPNAAWGLAFRRAEQQRQIMVEYGDSYKQVWAIEFNWILDPGGSCAGWGDWPTRWWQRVDEATQADYLVRAYQYAYNNWPWMGVMNVFNLDFATDYWRDYCEPVRWYSLTYRADHRDPANNPILPRPAYEALAAMPKPA